MLKGKSTIELTDVHTGKKEIYRDENLVTEAIADILNTNIQGAMFNNPYFDGKYGEDWMLPIYNRLTGGLLLYPVFLDMEEKKQIEVGTDFCSGLIKSFCDRLEAAGYFAGFYTSASFAGSVVTDAVRKRYCYWCAQWADACSYEDSCGIWQHSSNGSVPGINGRVDMDWSYQDFPTVIIGGGFNGYSKSADDTPTPVASKTVDELAHEVLAGNWGNGEDRKNRLTAAGYDYDSVQSEVNELCGIHNKPQPVYYTVKSGDTLSAIARQYDTTVSAIQSMNSSLIQNVNLILVGWKIRVK